MASQNLPFVYSALHAPFSLSPRLRSGVIQVRSSNAIPQFQFATTEILTR
jgi:hypothetical protein